jgi:hypothetical protein
MTTKFLSISALVEQAKARGFRASVSHDGTYAEIITPDHEGPEAVHWYGACYSCADVILSSMPSGYGYNPFFYGPFHPGLCRSTDSGVQKLLSHPAMEDCLREAA